MKKTSDTNGINPSRQSQPERRIEWSRTIDHPDDRDERLAGMNHVQAPSDHERRDRAQDPAEDRPEEKG